MSAPKKPAFFLRDLMTDEEKRDFDARMDVCKLMSLESYLFKDKEGHPLENNLDFHKAIQKPLVYYAHCLALYDTMQEQRDVELLQELGFAVFNPNCEKVQKGFKEQKFTLGEVKYSRDDPMRFFKELIQDSGFDALAFRALPDGRIPAGVWYEMDAARDAFISVIELPSSPGPNGTRRMTPQQTRSYLREVGQR